MEARIMAEKMRHLIESEPVPDADHISASFGVAEYRLDEGMDAWLRRADAALYEAKADGRNCVRAKSA